MQEICYKSSKYLYFYKAIDGKYIILNCLLNRLYAVSKEQYLSLLHEGQSLLGEEKEICIKEKILVPDNIDEINIMKKRISELGKSEVLYVVIVPTMLCNLECGYCLQEHKSVKINKELSENILKYISQNIDQYSSLYLDWFGGEPLMAQDEIFYILTRVKKLCHDKRKPFISTMTTNGYFLNYEVFKELKKNSVLYYQITIDGLDEHHNKMRPCKNGSPSFDIIINNIKDIITRCKSNSFRICIRLNIDKYLYENIDKVIDSFKVLFGDDSRIQFFLTPIVDMGGKKIEKIKDELLKRRDLLLDLNRKFYQAGLELYCEEKEGINVQQCYSYGKNNFTFNYNSQILKCNQGVGNSEFEKADICTVGSFNNSGCIELNENYDYWLNKKINVDCINCLFLALCQSVQCPLRLIKSERFCIKDNGYIDSLIERELIRENYINLGGLLWK